MTSTAFLHDKYLLGTNKKMLTIFSKNFSTAARKFYQIFTKNLCKRSLDPKFTMKCWFFQVLGKMFQVMQEKPRSCMTYEGVWCCVGCLVDATRVKLQPLRGQSGSDYINASCIDVSHYSTLPLFIWHNVNWMLSILNAWVHFKINKSIPKSNENQHNMLSSNLSL